jgi:transposase
MRSLSLDLRQRIVAAHEEGMTQTQIAQRFAVSQPTVCRLVKQWQSEHDLKEKPKSGRPPCLSAAQLPQLEALAASRTDWTLAQLADAWQERFGTRLSLTTLWRALQKQGFTHKKRAGSRSNKTPKSAMPSEKP